MTAIFIVVGSRSSDVYGELVCSIRLSHALHEASGNAVRDATAGMRTFLAHDQGCCRRASHDEGNVIGISGCVDRATMPPEPVNPMDRTCDGAGIAALRGYDAFRIAGGAIQSMSDAIVQRKPGRLALWLIAKRAEFRRREPALRTAAAP
jgi:hypothetical protein